MIAAEAIVIRLCVLLSDRQLQRAEEVLSSWLPDRNAVSSQSLGFITVNTVYIMEQSVLC